MQPRSICLTAIVVLAGCGGTANGPVPATPTATRMVATATEPPTATVTPPATATATLVSFTPSPTTAPASPSPTLDPQLQPVEPLQTSTEIFDYGRDVFEHETFGNEAFWTGLVGLLNGQAQVGGGSVSLLTDVILPAIDALDGATGNLFDCPGGRCNGNASTTNLEVDIPAGATIDNGLVALPMGRFATGLAVAKGSPLPIGVIAVDVAAATPGAVVTPLNATGRAFSFGVTCALCHTTVAVDGRQVDGLPNTQLQVGVLFALAHNSAALFPLSGVKPSDRDHFAASGSFDADGDGIPDADRALDFEVAVDLSFLNMPKGYFDATPDSVLDPTQIPHVVAQGNAPFLWDGLFASLSDLDNFVHTVDLDLTAAAGLAATLELAPNAAAFVGTQFQGAPAAARFADFAAYDGAYGNGPDAPGVLRVLSATHSGIRPTAAGAPPAQGVTGYRAARPDPHLGGLSSADAALEAEEQFQRALRGPSNLSEENATALATGAVARGARVSEQAGCPTCHAPPVFNSHGDGTLVTALGGIGTEPSRALFGSGVLKVPGTGFPTVIGYKNQSHRFVFATAPYLHDGGAAAADTDGDGVADLFGVVNTLLGGVDPQPRASLQVLLDPVLRTQAIAGNQLPSPLTGVAPAAVHITGDGHLFFVAAGVPKPGGGAFTQQDQADLIAFLLALDDDPGH